MDKKNIFSILIILIIGVIIFAIIYVFNYGRRANNFENLKKIEDYNTFFSITKNVNNYISNNNKYYLIDESYINRKFINRSNINKKIKTYAEDISFDALSISYVNIKNNVLYYASGRLKRNEFEKETIVDNNFSVILLVDYEKYVISFYPTTKKSYKEDIDRIIEIDIKKNNYNQFEPAGIIKEDVICSLYLNDFINLSIEDISKSYSLLDNNTTSLFSSQEDYNSFINGNINKMSTNIKSCDIDSSDKNKVYKIYDKNNNYYEFIEYAVMDYKVNFVLG